MMNLLPVAENLGKIRNVVLLNRLPERSTSESADVVASCVNEVEPDQSCV